MRNGGFPEMLELQSRFVEDARALGIDVEVTSLRDGTALTTRTGILAERYDREQARLAAEAEIEEEDG